MSRPLKEMEAERDAKVERIRQSKLFKEREEFTPSTLAREMEGESRESIRYALEHMVREDMLVKRKSNSNVYFRPKVPNLCKMDWRSNPAVHAEIERLFRGW